MIDDLDPVILAAVRALADALDGIAPPCWSDPDGWYAPNPSDAIRACEDRCHGIGECADLADLYGERHGVWGGTDRAARKAAA